MHLPLRAAMDWEIHQMDMETIFFDKILDVKVYMNQPKGFVQEKK